MQGNPKGSTGVLCFFSVGFMWLGALFKFALGIFFFLDAKYETPQYWKKIVGKISVLY